MKQLFIIVAMLVVSTAAFAQSHTKTDIVKPPVPQASSSKKEFKIDYDKRYELVLSLSATDVSLLTRTPDQWKAVKRSQLTGEQISSIEEYTDELRRKLNEAVLQAIAKDQEKLNADTAASNKQ